MNEMVERVKRAICKSRTCEGMMCCEWPANRGRLACPVKGGGYDDAARAAIEAMRDVECLPMLVAGKNALFSCSEDPTLEDARNCFHAILAVALTEKRPSRQE